MSCGERTCAAAEPATAAAGDSFSEREEREEEEDLRRPILHKCKNHHVEPYVF